LICVNIWRKNEAGAGFPRKFIQYIEGVPYDKEKQKFTALNFPRHYPLVLLVKACCRPNILLGSEEDMGMGSALLGRQRLSIGVNFLFGGQQCAKLNSI
jgi:hypothetical protein